MKTTENVQETGLQIMNPTDLLEQWQGHRRLTRKVIQAFPEKEFFGYTLGGMRPFAEMVMELLALAGPGIREIETGETAVLRENFDHRNSKDYLLSLWDEATDIINDSWEKIPIESFSTTSAAFGQHEGTHISHILYYIDNEIHHRGQAYVYLRSLGIEPPLFYDRS